MTSTIRISPTGRRPIAESLYGVFFEDINRAGEGGIYAELIQNRFFEESITPPRSRVTVDGELISPTGWVSPFVQPGSLPGWSAVCPRGAMVRLDLDRSEKMNAAREASLRVSIIGGGREGAGVANEGYGGIPLKEGERYFLTLWARGDEYFRGALDLCLLGGEDSVYAQAHTAPLTRYWQKFELELVATGTDPCARLALTTMSTGVFWLGMVSLFPANTYKGRPNGLRRDLLEMVEALEPKFLRFPGGCVVEGFSLETALRFKNSTGDPARRRGQWSLWHYRVSNGLGFHEFLQMAEDLGAAPLYVINCGMTCQARKPELVPMDRLGEWVQDALDAIEYANGPVESRWGAARAKNGHPEPFGLRDIEIGNENWGPEYEKRYTVFYDAIRERWPEIRIIANNAIDRPADFVDDHYYASPEFFAAHFDHYETEDENGPQVYVGEYAATIDCGGGNLKAAVGEAAFLVGLERAPGVVKMASYAPLFKNVMMPTWNPDLIVFDSSRAYGTPSYHAQKLFAQARGKELITAEVMAPMRANISSGGITLGGLGGAADFRDVNVTDDETVLYSWSPAALKEDWMPIAGDWYLGGGVLSQQVARLHKNGSAGSTAGARYGSAEITAGSPDWTDYTVTFEVCRASEEGGVQVHFRDNAARGDSQDHYVLTFGAPGASALVEHLQGWAREQVAAGEEYSLEPGRWYRVRLDVKGMSVRAEIEGELLVEGTIRPLPGLAAVATQDGDEVILKVVNPSGEARETSIALSGLGAVQPEGRMWVITSASPDDENSFEEPEKVAAVEHPLTGAGETFTHAFPAWSITVMRLKIK